MHSWGSFWLLVKLDHTYTWVFPPRKCMETWFFESITVLFQVLSCRYAANFLKWFFLKALKPLDLILCTVLSLLCISFWFSPYHHHLPFCLAGEWVFSIVVLRVSYSRYHYYQVQSSPGGRKSKLVIVQDNSLMTKINELSDGDFLFLFLGSTRE